MAASPTTRRGGAHCEVWRWWVLQPADPHLEDVTLRSKVRIMSSDVLANLLWAQEGWHVKVLLFRALVRNGNNLKMCVVWGLLGNLQETESSELPT